MTAAAVASVSMGVMKPVLAKLATLMGDEYKKIKGLRKKVTFLQRELSDMEAFLEKMDSADELDPQAKKWRREIIEMSYDIEDHIDYFMLTVGEADSKIGILQKAAKYLRTFNDRLRHANDFQEIETQVIEASERRKRYMLDQCISVTAPVVIDPRMSALYKKSASLVGIESQKDDLVSWAMDEVKQLKFLAIVGVGGLGKTTLAKEVYHEVRGKFECKAFISVSQKAQMIALFNSLLEQLGLQRYAHACQLEDPINRLRGHLQDKRYIIVIDDLWDMKAWDDIQCVFPESNPYGRIIITTRNENVAKSCYHNHGCIHNMKQLSEQDSRKLFFDRIFVSEDAFPIELKKASSEILKKCGGLPLAIITMASMLACQPRILQGQWEYIHNLLDTWSTTNSKYEDMMYILDLSYKNLPCHLKTCFLYLGCFPEDHEISRVELVRRWVAEGFVSNSTGQDVWDVAESYFNELVNRSMIQPIYDEYNFVVSSCRVHDMLLDLIVRRCKEDNFLHLVNKTELVEEVQDDFQGTRSIYPGKGKGTRMAEQRTPHLYLLFDDWHSGYSIRKVSLSRRSGKQHLPSGAAKEGVEPVPEVFMHMRALRGYPDLFTSAFGTKIMAMHPDMTDDDTTAIPMIDVQEQTSTFGPEPCNHYSFPICFPIGDNRLFILDTGKFDCYLWTPEHGEEPWGSQAFPRPPFNRADVSSYGVLPDGCILVSTTKSFGGARTFIFDTTKEEYVWKPYRNWVLPFTGRGHYDTSLGGFVSLSKDGYLYCSTMAANTTRTGLGTGKTLHTKEKVYTECCQHVSATLVHMSQGKFCLVECVSIDKRRTGQELRESWHDGEPELPLEADVSDFVGGGPQGGRCIYRLRTFNLTYDTKGDCLKLKNCKGQGRCYSLPHEARIGSVCMDPVAFWL